MFKYKVGGDPFPTIEWFKGINLLTDTDTFTFKKNEETDEYSFIIHSVTTDDGGKYTCVLTNEVGVEKQPVTLMVKEGEKLEVPAMTRLRR